MQNHPKTQHKTAKGRREWHTAIATEAGDGLMALYGFDAKDLATGVVNALA
jgi:hypothetical protein